MSVGGITRALIPAAIGGAGAVAVDIGVGYLSNLGPVPDFLKSGYGKVALQVAAAFGMGYLTKKLLKKPDLAHAVTLGALTVAGYGLIKTVVKQAAPTLPGLAGDYRDNLSAYMLPPAVSGLGYANPAPMMADSLAAYMDQSGGVSGFDGTSDGM